MKITDFLKEFTTEKLTQKTSSRREVFGTFGSIGKKAALMAIPFGLVGTHKTYAQSSGNSAVDALQLALTLEYLEAEFYLKALQSGVLPSGGRAEAVINQIHDHEDAHVNFLISGLGNNSIESPEFDFTAGGLFDPFNENGTGQEIAYAQILALAQAFEDTGVRAYKGQAPNLMGTEFLTPALQIHSVEARHASEVRRLRADVMNENLNVNALGWITLNNRGPAMPQQTQAVYDGEENLMQLGVDVTSATDFGSVAVSQSYDEPMSAETATSIASLFIV